MVALKKLFVLFFLASFHVVSLTDELSPSVCIQFDKRDISMKVPSDRIGVSELQWKGKKLESTKRLKLCDTLDSVSLIYAFRIGKIA